MTVATAVPLAAAVRAAAQRLAAAGVESPRHDAEELAAHVLGVRRGALAGVDDLPPQAAERYDDLVARRALREPLQHLTGVAGFRRLVLAVGPGGFVPRPETEVVTEAAIQAAMAAGPRPLVVDLCTGTGAIALAVAQEVPSARVHGVEREPAALRWAERNVAATGLPVRLHLADAAVAVPEYDGRVDVVVSNPPYVPLDERDTVAPEVRYDPDPALWGGPDGLDTIRTVLAAAARLLRPDGVLVVEHSDRHGGAVPDLLSRGGWADVADHRDLAGRPRYATARRTV